MRGARRASTRHRRSARSTSAIAIEASSIVAIQVQQTVQAGRDYAARYGSSTRIGADVTGDFFHLYRVFALPTQFFIDPDGRIRQIVNGPLIEADAATTIESILPPGSGPPAPTPSPS